MYASVNWITIISDDGFPFVWHQAITQTIDQRVTLNRISVFLMHSYLQIQLSIALIQLEIPPISLNIALILSNLVRLMFIFAFGIAFKLKLSSLCFYFP